MSCISGFLVVVCVACLSAIACDSPGNDPLVPTQSVVSAPSSLAGGKPNAGGAASAGGHADVNATPVQNVQHEIYSFTAIPSGPFPLAEGQVQVRFHQFTGEQFTVHARVSCVSIVANEAWVGSQVTRYVIDGVAQPERVGGPMIFRVRDNGEGHGVRDLASLVFFGVPAGGDLAYCNARPAFPLLFESMNGNIQVKP